MTLHKFRNLWAKPCETCETSKAMQQHQPPVQNLRFARRKEHSCCPGRHTRRIVPSTIRQIPRSGRAPYPADEFSKRRPGSCRLRSGERQAQREQKDLGGTKPRVHFTELLEHLLCRSQEYACRRGDLLAREELPELWRQLRKGV